MVVFEGIGVEKAGWKQKDISVALDVTKGAVSQWLAAARDHGPAVLRT